jgi:hypothetical protein
VADPENFFSPRFEYARECLRAALRESAGRTPSMRSRTSPARAPLRSCSTASNTADSTDGRAIHAALISECSGSASSVRLLSSRASRRGPIQVGTRESIAMCVLCEHESLAPRFHAASCLSPSSLPRRSAPGSCRRAGLEWSVMTSKSSSVSVPHCSFALPAAGRASARVSTAK